MWVTHDRAPFSVDGHALLFLIGPRKYPLQRSGALVAVDREFWGLSSRSTESFGRSGDGGPGNTCHQRQHRGNCPLLCAPRKLQHRMLAVRAPAVRAACEGHGEIWTHLRGRCVNPLFKGCPISRPPCHTWVPGCPLRFLCARTLHISEPVS